MPETIPNTTYTHLKPRYSFRKVCKIFNIHEDTLRAWMRDGVRGADGRRIDIAFMKLGPRKVEFECDEIERVYAAMRCFSAAPDANVLPFRSRRDESRALAEAPAQRTRDRAATG